MNSKIEKVFLQTIVIALTVLFAPCTTIAANTWQEIGPKDSKYEKMIVMIKDYKEAVKRNVGKDQLRRQEEDLWITANEINTLTSYYAYSLTCETHGSEAFDRIDKLSKKLAPASIATTKKIRGYLNRNFTGVINLTIVFGPESGWGGMDLEANWRNASVTGAKPPVVSDGSELFFNDDPGRIYIFIRGKWWLYQLLQRARKSRRK